MKGLNLHFYANLFCFVIFNFCFLNPKQMKNHAKGLVAELVPPHV